MDQWLSLLPLFVTGRLKTQRICYMQTYKEALITIFNWNTSSVSTCNLERPRAGSNSMSKEVRTASGFSIFSAARGNPSSIVSSNKLFKRAWHSAELLLLVFFF